MGVKLKVCVECKSRFVGSIDPSGRLCSTRCSIVHGPFKSYELPVYDSVKGVRIRPQNQKPKKIRIRHLKRKAGKSVVKGLVKEINRLQKELNAKAASSEYKPSFYTSDAWRSIRYRVLKASGRTCSLCKITKGVMHVDHIKSRSKFPALELEFSNLQVLCEDCNLGKGNSDEIDWR